MRMVAVFYVFGGEKEFARLSVIRDGERYIISGFRCGDELTPHEIEEARRQFVERYGTGGVKLVKDEQPPW